jgi:hypothetical protein
LTASSKKGYTLNEKPKYIWLSYSKKWWKFSFTSWDNRKSWDEKFKPPAISTNIHILSPSPKNCTIYSKHKLKIIIKNPIHMLIKKSLSKIKTMATFATVNLHHEKNIHTKRNGNKQN